MESKKCIQCSAVFYKPESCSKKEWEEQRKFCSYKCHNDYRRGKYFVNSGTFKKGHQSWLKGKHLPEEVKKKLSLSLKGRKPNAGSFEKGQFAHDKHPNWKGEKAGKKPIHEWVKRYKQKPLECEHCGRDDKLLEWCNIDHKYRRELDDYIALCRSCHRLYDIKNNGYKRLIN